MICLGLESTAHTFGLGIVKDKKILANIKGIYTPKPGSGIVPADAAKHHRIVCKRVITEALDKAKIKEKDINVIAISAGPGLPPCLLVGMEQAKGLSEKIGKPLIGVNHCIAHIEIGKLDTGLKDPLTVYVSGGNTQIIALRGNRYRVFGETLDIAIGNAMDKVAREMGLGMPGGLAIEQLARKGKKYIELPYTVKGMDLSFSGLVTATIEMRGKVSDADLVYSFHETALSMLTEVTERALAHTEKKELMLTGGVAQDKRLQKMMKTMALEHGAAFAVPKKEYCGDNGAMIAWTGLLMHNAGVKQKKIDVWPRWRTDEIEVLW